VPGALCPLALPAAWAPSHRQTVVVPGPRASSVALALLVYVIPLAAGVGYLVAVGLPVLAAGLLAAELAVLGAIWAARRGSNG
jgi:hypothetical protein